jgi:hypothetical protein
MLARIFVVWIFSVGVALSGCPGGSPVVISFQQSTSATHHSLSIADSSTLSTSLWFRVTAESGTLGLLGFGVGSHFAQFVMTINVDTQRYGGRIRGDYFTISSPGTFLDGGWHNLVATWAVSDGQVAIFEDGALVGSTYIGGSGLDSPGCFVVGQVPSGSCTLGSGFASFASGSGFQGSIMKVPSEIE